MTEALNDASPMPFGMHKGVDMEDVPAKWLMWLYDRNKDRWKRGILDNENNRVMEYIEDNMDVLKKEIKEGRG